MSAHVHQPGTVHDTSTAPSGARQDEHIDLALAWAPLALGFLFFLVPPLFGFAGTYEALTSYALGAFVGALGILMRVKILNWDGVALIGLGLVTALSPIMQGFSLAAIGFWGLLLLGLITAATGFAIVYRRRGLI